VTRSYDELLAGILFMAVTALKMASVK